MNKEKNIFREAKKEEISEILNLYKDLM